MSTENPSERPRPGRTEPDRAPRAVRILGLVAVCIGVAAIAAATFVLSYSGIHVLALQAGISPRLARGYPLVIDAMLVIVLAAVLSLRGAGLPSKLFAWITLLAVLAAAAGADALHAAGRRLPDHEAAVTAAVVPWVLVFLAFALLLAMLRYARVRRLAVARSRVVPHGEARSHWQPESQRDVTQPVPAPPTGPPLDLPARPPQEGVSPAPVFDAAVAGTAVADAVAVTGAAVADAVAVTDMTVDPGLTADTAAPGSDAGASDPDARDLGARDPGASDPEASDPGAADGPPDSTKPNAVLPALAPEARPGMYPTVQPVLAVPRQPGPAAVADADAGFSVADTEHQDLAIDADLVHDDPSSDEAAADPADGDVPCPADDAGPGLVDGSAADGDEPSAPEGNGFAAQAYRGEAYPLTSYDQSESDGDSPEAGSHDAEPAAREDAAGEDAAGEDAAGEGAPDPDMPVFHRMWSSPTPPAGM